MVSLADTIKQDILTKLEEIATPKKKERELAFFKYKVPGILGTGIKPMRSVVEKMVPVFKTASNDDLIGAVKGLMDTKIYEAQMAGIEILYLCKDRFDLNYLFELCSAWIECGLLDSWATVDNASKYVMGYAVMANSELVKVTYRWTKSKNVWMRRASLVVYIIPAREKNSFPTIFKTAKKLMNDKGEYVLKAVGWVLREAGDVDKRRLENFIFKHGKNMRRVCLRSAIENFPPEERGFLLEQTKAVNYLEEKYQERFEEDKKEEK